MIVAAGLHSLNLQDGSGWDYNCITGKMDYTEAAVTTAVIGILAGSYMLATGNNLVRDIVSNVIVDGNDLYFASKEKIIRVQKTGEVIWEYPLINDMSSKSSIFLINDRVYMVNYGSAFKGDRQIIFGKPFIASFNKETGEREFFTTINVKRDPIKGFYITNDTMLLLFNERISLYSMKTGGLIFENSINTKESGYLNSFIGDNFYIKDSLLTRLNYIDTMKIFVYTDKGKTLSINKDLSIAGEIDSDKLYYQYIHYKNYKFISNTDNTIVLDENDNVIAEFKLAGEPILAGEKMYYKKEKSLLEIDIQNFFEDSN